MGGRGTAGGSSTGKQTGGGAISVPKFTKAQVSKMSRSQLETLATAVFANNAIKSGLSKAEGIYRAKSLMSGNTTAQLRKYVLKHNN